MILQPAQSKAIKTLVLMVTAAQLKHSVNPLIAFFYSGVCVGIGIGIYLASFHVKFTSSITPAAFDPDSDSDLRRETG